MIVTCPHCNHRGNVNDKRIPEQGRYIVCPKCKERFFVTKTQETREKRQKTSTKDKLNVINTEETRSGTNTAEQTRTAADEIDVYHLVCPGCGAIIDKPNDLKGNIFHCKHCKSVIVSRDDFDGPKQKLRHLLELARSSEKAGEYQQAYKWYTKLIEIDSKNPAYWMGKARIAGHISSFHNQRIDEMLHAFRYAISAADGDKKEALGGEAGEFIFRRCRGYLASMDELRDEAIYLETSYPTRRYAESLDIDTFNNYVVKIIDGMIEASEYLPDNPDIVDTIIEVCEKRLPPLASPELYNYRKAVLGTFVEKRKQFDPESLSLENNNKEGKNAIIKFLLMALCLCIAYSIIPGLIFLIEFLIRVLQK